MMALSGQLSIDDHRVSYRIHCSWLAQTYSAAHAHMGKNDHAPCDGSAADNFARQGTVVVSPPIDY